MRLVTSVIRPSGPPLHEGRDAYLKLFNAGDPRICHASTGKDAKNKPKQPWLTLVFGSGCAHPEGHAAALERKAAELGRIVDARHPGLYVELENPGTAVEAFARDLIADRLSTNPNDDHEDNGHADGKNPSPDRDRPDPVDGDGLPKLLADVFLIAVLTSRLYFCIKSRGHDAPRRHDHDDTAVLTRASTSWGPLNENYIAPCGKLVQSVLKDLKPVAGTLGATDDGIRRLSATLQPLLTSIAGSLHADWGQIARVSLADVHSLTEFAWFCLTSATDVAYPGWSDLLLDLSNHDAANRVGTPLFSEMLQAEQFIRERYADITGKSWVRLRNEDSPTFFGKAARVLNAQNAFIRRCKRSKAPPSATAFVTSFDVELELALLDLGQPFTLALPVHVVNTHLRVAHTCWIGLRIPASSDEDTDPDRLSRLMAPGDDARTWCILDQSTRFDVPVVVRLAGCPLIKLPGLGRVDGMGARLKALNGQDWEDGHAAGFQLRHAVILNEHDAMWQNAVDLILLPDGLTAFKRYGLPESLVANHGRWSRFWMMLGVKIRDNAVRHRIATLVSSVPLTASESLGGDSISQQRGRDEDTAEEPAGEGAEDMAGSIGVAVNWRTSDLERDLLYWNGFQVVQAAVEDFGEPLEHYSWHLENHSEPVTSGHLDGAPFEFENDNYPFSVQSRCEPDV